jgi:protein-disulfide isomerase
MRQRSRLLSVAIAVVVTAAAIVLSIVGSSSSVDHAAVARMQRMLARVPQRGTVLGKPSAPVTVFEFADLQCPYCANYMQTLFADDVVPGKINMVLDTVWLLGDGSRWAAHAAAAAAAQNKMWNFADAFYYNQGAEGSGYVTPGFIREIGSAVPGLNVNKMLVDSSSPATVTLLKAMHSFALNQEVVATPTFLVERADGHSELVVGSGKLEAAIDHALAASGRKSTANQRVE